MNNTPTDRETIQNIEQEAHNNQYELSMTAAHEMQDSGVSRDVIAQSLSDTYKQMSATVIAVMKAEEPDFAIRRAEYRGRETGALEALEDFVAGK